MARPRKDTSALQGSYTKEAMKERLESENKVKGKSDKLVAPDILKLDDVALEKFEELVRELKEVDIITNVDVDLLAVYALAWSRYVKATKMLMLQSMVEEQENKAGVIIKTQNPYIKIQQTSSQELIKLASLFGLSPADRTRIAHLNPSDKNEQSDPLLELLGSLKR